MHISSVGLPRIAVVIGSNRPQRIYPEIAAWVQRALRAAALHEVELGDLQEIDLPFLDEPIMASRGRYAHEHTARWSELVRSYDGFVFVFPQYNWGLHMRSSETNIELNTDEAMLTPARRRGCRSSPDRRGCRPIRHRGSPRRS